MVYRKLEREKQIQVDDIITHFAGLTIPEIQEMLGHAVNCLIKHFYRPEKEVSIHWMENPHICQLYITIQRVYPPSELFHPDNIF